MWSRGGLTISTDPAHLDVPLIHRFLHDESYWAAGVPRAIVDQAIAGSLNFGVFSGDPSRGVAAQIGYARVVTDGATFAWLCDVFVVPPHRGKGLATWLIETVVGHPDLQAQRSFILGTRDAHQLYAKFGWQPIEAGRFMRIHRPYRT